MTASVRVLHVDDDPEFADLTATFLEREHERFVVETAIDADEGLDLLETTDVDCVVSDYDMPGTNGIEFLEAVREAYPELPFVLFTGKGSEAVASEAISAGVTEYLQKGGGTDKYELLAHRIRNAVDQYQADRERRQWQRAVETVDEGIAIIDADGRFVRLNDTYADVYGQRAEAVVGTNWRRWYPDDEVTRFEDDVLPALRRDGTWEGTAVCRRSDGTRVEQRLSLATLDDGDGHVCVLKDVSEAGTDDTRRPTALLETLFAQSPDMINVHDGDGNVLAPNPRLCERTGYDEATLTDMKVWELDVAIDPEEASALWERLDPGDRHRLEGEYRCRDGSTFPVEVHVRRLDVDGDDRFIAISRDVSERKARERELRRNGRAIEAAPIGITITDPDRDDNPLVYANDEFTALTGYESEDVVGWNHRKLQGPDTRPEPVAELRRAIDAGEPTTVELRNYRSDGTMFWNRVSITPLRDETGTITNWVGFQEDVTERKRHERALERHNDLFERAQAIADVGAWEYDVETETSYVTDEAMAIHGLAPDDDLHPEKSIGYYHPEDQPTIRSAFTRAVEEGEPYDLELRLRTADGDQRWVRTRGDPQIEGGEVVRVRGTIQDVTDRKQRETELEQIRDRIEYVLEATDALVWERDLDSDEVTTYPRPDPVFDAELDSPADFLDRLHPDDRSRAEDAIQTAIDAGESYSVELRTGPDQAPKWVEDRGEPITDEEGDVVRLIGITRDVTEAKRRERTLQRKNERLETFAEFVSHDLRNPLNIAMARLELARDDADGEHLEAVAREHERMADLIEDVLALAREGDEVDETQAVDLASFGERCWQSVETPDATLSTDADRPIRADRDRLQRLLENLFRNAVEHGGDEVSVTVRTVEEGFAVADDGPGIPDGERADVFESGYSSTTDTTGFGLAIVEGIAEAHGWEVGVTESADGGAEFVFTGVEFAED